MAHFQKLNAIKRKHHFFTLNQIKNRCVMRVRGVERIMYVGEISSYGGNSTCLMRMQTLKKLGHEVIPVDTTSPWVESYRGYYFHRIINKVGYPPDISGANDKILKLSRKMKFDILWVDKGRTIKADTLEEVKKKCPQAVIVNYSPDDMTHRMHYSRFFEKSIPIYDIHFSTKSFNLNILKFLGAKKVVYVPVAYDPQIHTPMVISDKEKKMYGGKVSFIGRDEKDRYEYLLGLAKGGISVRVWGPSSWKKWRGDYENLILEGRYLMGKKYAKGICASDINLCFLSSLVEDKITTRSVEIPACGGFMLAERTKEHLEFFEEGQEAEYFDSMEELVDKVKYYLREEGCRKKIARAGRERCVRSGYDYASRIRSILEEIYSIKSL